LSRSLAEARPNSDQISSFDYSTDVMKMSYTARAVPGARLAPDALTRIFVPERKYPTGYSVSATNARVVSSPTAPWIELTAAPPGAAVSVTISPRTGAYTLTPLQTDAFPLAASGRHCRAVRFVSIRLPRMKGHVRRIVVSVNGRRRLVTHRSARVLRLRVPSSKPSVVRIVVTSSHGRAMVSRRYRAMPCQQPAEW